MKLFIFALLAIAACAEEEKKAEIAAAVPYATALGALPYAAWGGYNTLPYSAWGGYNTLPYSAAYAAPYAYNYAAPYAYNYAPITTAAKIELPKVEVKEIELPKVELKAAYAPATYAYAAPATYAAAYAPATYAVAPAPVASSQFHAQDELQNVNWGYANINSVKQEVGNANIGVSGSYSYVDANNEIQVVNYIADGLGFRVEDSRLPVAPVYTGVAPEPVVYNGVAPEPVTYDGVAPEPVVDTPEVAAAKAEFLAAFEAEKNREKRESDPAIVYGYNTLPYAYSAGYYSSALPIRSYNYPYTYGYSPRAFYGFY